jgi:dTMP kinase
MPDRGKFIVLEGPDGAGKSTIARQLRSRFVDCSPGCILTSEPTDGPLGTLIRQALRHEVTLAPAAMAPLYASDRLHHVATVIEPALARGEVVICDRYELSNLVYRAAEQPVWRCAICVWEGWDENEHARPIRRCPGCDSWRLGSPRRDALTYARALSRCIARPDLTIVLTAPLDVCAARRRARGGKVELFDGDSLQARVHALYADAQRLLPGERVAMVDASGSAEEVEELTWKAATEVIDG